MGFRFAVLAAAATLLSYSFLSAPNSAVPHPDGAYANGTIYRGFANDHVLALSARAGPSASWRTSESTAPAELVILGL